MHEENKHPGRINSLNHAISMLGLTQREVAAETDPKIHQTVIARVANDQTWSLEYDFAATIAKAIVKAYAKKYPQEEPEELIIGMTPEGTSITRSISPAQH